MNANENISTISADSEKDVLIMLEEQMSELEGTDSEDVQNSDNNCRKSSELDSESKTCGPDELESASHSSSDEKTQDGKKMSYREEYEKFLAHLGQISEVEAKLQFAIEFMEGSLAQKGTPHFKSFWEARNLCLLLFKENVAAPVRSILWAKYNELSKEARRLKEILDEQSAFAVEQIEIAIKALENDIASSKESIQKIVPIDFGVTHTLNPHVARFQELQSELSLLNTFASRINALRKELIKTEMRVRQKNKFFERLSQAGDRVFPQRKELIKNVSQLFAEDVDAFVTTHFSQEQLNENSLYALREEIKLLQNMAKVLTLNTHAFTHTRMRLSECWDKIKNEEKNRKKERSQLKAIFKQNIDDSLAKIKAFQEAFQNGQVSVNEAAKNLDQLANEIRALEISRDDWKLIRDELNAARRSIQEKAEAGEAVRLQQDRDKENLRKGKIIEIKRLIEETCKQAADIDVEVMISQRDAISDKITSAAMNKAEKLEIERQMKPLRDLISEKKESVLLALSDDDRESLLHLKDVLQQRKQRRQEIKEQIDILRKASGSSGLDFEQAMNYNVQVAAEKERLEKINQGIKEIEEKIADLSLS